MFRFLAVLIFLNVNSIHAQLYFTNHGTITFSSEASEEIIKATSNKLRGAIDPVKRTFVFKVAIRSFEGFNSALQQEHFNEKYLESDRFTEAIFQGKIIEDIDLSIDGEYNVRAKGQLNIHGVQNERIIRCVATVSKNMIKVFTNFTVLVSDHNIKVPKIVHEKIASEINIEVNAELSPTAVE